MQDDIPKLLRENSEALAERRKQIQQPHVAPLTEFVRNLRGRMGVAASIPYFDPWDGGVNADVLFLLEAPGPKARNSGFVSRNNPDETAKNFFELNQQANIERKRTVVWNVVPWYIGAESKIRPATAVDIAAGIESLGDLLELLPRVRDIVLIGKKSQRAEQYLRNFDHALRLHKSHHPSPMFVNRRAGNRQLLLNEFLLIRTYLP